MSIICTRECREFLVRVRSLYFYGVERSVLWGWEKKLNEKCISSRTRQLTAVYLNEFYTHFCD